MKIFKNTNNQVKNIWWIAIFFMILACLTIPVIFIAQHFNFEITMWHQAIIVICVNIICQKFRNKPFSEITGVLNRTWITKLIQGIIIGALLMLLPALVLYVLGHVTWHKQEIGVDLLFSITITTISVAAAEEFLFRGFLFQRLFNWIGIYGAQLLIAAYFLLTHLNNPGMTDDIKLLASLNIFLASIMFGLAFIKSKSISMPIGIHFASNWVQGTLLGFGVSGYKENSILNVKFNTSSKWLTGGSFGIEASILGLLFVIATIIIMHKWNVLTNILVKKN